MESASSSASGSSFLLAEGCCGAGVIGVRGVKNRTSLLDRFFFIVLVLIVFPLVFGRALLGRVVCVYVRACLSVGTCVWLCFCLKRWHVLYFLAVYCSAEVSDTCAWVCLCVCV